MKKYNLIVLIGIVFVSLGIVLLLINGILEEKNNNIEKDDDNGETIEIDDDNGENVNENLDVIGQFSSLIINSDSIYKNDRYDINNITLEELLVTALDKMNIPLSCDDINKKIITIEQINQQLEKYINKKITLDEIRKILTNGNLDITIKNSFDFNYSLSINKDNELEVINNTCDFKVKQIIKSHLIKTETKGDYVYVYEKKAFANMSEKSNDKDVEKYYIDYYDNYNKLGNALETISLSDSKVDLNWDIYKTYKYTFKKSNGKYYFQSLEIVN